MTDHEIIDLLRACHARIDAQDVLIRTLLELVQVLCDKLKEQGEAPVCLN